MTMKQRIKKEIARQQSIEGGECQAELLLHFLSIVKYESQWRAFVRCEFHKYGNQSYESYRFYRPPNELLMMLKEGVKCQ